MLYGANAFIWQQKSWEMTTAASHLPPALLYTLAAENFLLRAKKENKINRGGRSS